MAWAGKGSARNTSTAAAAVSAQPTIRCQRARGRPPSARGGAAAGDPPSGRDGAHFVKRKKIDNAKILLYRAGDRWSPAAGMARTGPGRRRGRSLFDTPAGRIQFTPDASRPMPGRPGGADSAAGYAN